jgi:ligand-binding sensor domain-containing protein
MKHLYSLLVVLILIASCSGQDKTSLLKDSAREPKVIPARQVETTTPWVDTTFLRSNRVQISEYIPRIFQDKTGDIWFGTNGDGACRYDGKSFIYFTEKEGLGGRAVRDIIQDRSGNLWFGTNGGVSRYDGKTFTTFTVKDGLIHNQVWSIVQDRSGVSRYDGKTFTGFPLPAADLNGVRNAYPAPKLINCIFQDKTGKFWFGSNGGGVYCYDGKVLTNISEKDGLCNNFVRCILEDKNGNLWFATQFGGVSRYDGKTFANFTEKEGLISNFVWTMIEDRIGNLWFGTAGWGVCCYNGRSFAHYSQEEGLGNKHAQSILEDKNGNLWFGTSGGVYRYNGRRFTNFIKVGAGQ